MSSRRSFGYGTVCGFHKLGNRSDVTRSGENSCFDMSLYFDRSFARCSLASSKNSGWEVLWYPIPNFLGNIRPRNGKVLSAVIKVILKGYQNKFRKFGFAWGCVGMFLHLSPVQEYVYQRVAPFARGTYVQCARSCQYH